MKYDKRRMAVFWNGSRDGEKLYHPERIGRKHENAEVLCRDPVTVHSGKLRGMALYAIVNCEVDEPVFFVF